jgi:hypothetical protein
MNARWSLGVLVVAAGLPALHAEAPVETGLQAEVLIKLPTRLDWEFATATLLSGVPPGARRLPPSYHSTLQRYQLYIPPAYQVNRPWPMVVFVSPGDDPLGWPAWQKVCQDRAVFFCAAYGGGNNCNPVRRVRLVLDMLDDVRRKYRIDPSRTYLVGFGGGGRVACTLAYALPEYFGGVAALSGGSVPAGLDYLRHRTRERLSVAVVTGEGDFERRESEQYLAPLLRDLDVRSRLWVVPQIGHELPPAAVLAEVHAWLENDLSRRLEDVRRHPGLAVAPDEVPLRSEQAGRLLAAARDDLRDPDRVWQGAALLEGVVARWEGTEAAVRAQVVLHTLRADARQGALLRRQRAAEEGQKLAAQAKALERFGQPRAARQTWDLLAQAQPETAEGGRAAAESRRLAALLAAAPYLGLVFEGETTVVKTVAPRGPAARAGLRRGDQVVKLGDAATASPEDVRSALRSRKPGDWLAIEVRRGADMLNLPVEVGMPPAEKE